MATNPPPLAEIKSQKALVDKQVYNLIDPRKQLEDDEQFNIADDDDEEDNLPLDTEEALNPMIKTQVGEVKMYNYLYGEKFGDPIAIKAANQRKLLRL